MLQGFSCPGAKCEPMPLDFSEIDAEIDSGARPERHAGFRAVTVSSRFLCSQFAVVNSRCMFALCVSCMFVFKAVLNHSL